MDAELLSPSIGRQKARILIRCGCDGVVSGEISETRKEKKSSRKKKDFRKAKSEKRNLEEGIKKVPKSQPIRNDRSAKCARQREGTKEISVEKSYGRGCRSRKTKKGLPRRLSEMIQVAGEGVTRAEVRKMISVSLDWDHGP